MSITTAIGFLVGLALFIGAIAMETDNYPLLVDKQCRSRCGGTLANGFISYQGRYVLRAIPEVGRMFSHAKVNQGIVYAQSRKVVEVKSSTATVFSH